MLRNQALCNVIFGISLFLISSLCEAKEVTVTGWGKDYDQALINAKLSAIESVAGTFVISDRVYRTDEKLFEEIKQYNGGVIKSYEVLKATQSEVTIKADVDVIKDNHVFVRDSLIDNSNSEKIINSLNNFNQRLEMMKALDNPSTAFFIKTNSMSFTPQEGVVKVRLENEIVWQPKWISDLESFVKLSGNEGATHTNTKEKISANLLNQLISINPLAAIVGSAAYEKANPPVQQKQNPMVCFTSKKDHSPDGCYELASEFNWISFYSDMKVEVTAFSNAGKLIYTNTVTIPNVDIYERKYPGDYVTKWFGTKQTFDQPAYLIYSESVFKFALDLGVHPDTSKLISYFSIQAI